MQLRCARPAECSPFPTPGEPVDDPADILQVVVVEGTDCRRSAAGVG